LKNYEMIILKCVIKLQPRVRRRGTFNFSKSGDFIVECVTVVTTINTVFHTS